MRDISSKSCVIEFVYPRLEVGDALMITLLSRHDELIVLNGSVQTVDGDFAQVAFEGVEEQSLERLSSLLDEALS